MSILKDFIASTIEAVALYKKLLGKGNAYAEKEATTLKELYDKAYSLAELAEKQEATIAQLMYERDALHRELFVQGTDKGSEDIRLLHSRFRHSTDPQIQGALKAMIETHVEILKLAKQ